MITLTANAKEALAKIVGNNKIRLKVEGGGCSGFQYQLDLTDTIADSDTSIEYEDFTVVIDKKSVLFVQGIQIDYSNTLMESGFKFTNPNATKTCGCGISFSI